MRQLSFSDLGDFSNSPSRVKAIKLKQKTLFMMQNITKVNVTVFVNAIMFYKVRYAIHTVKNVDSYDGSA